MLWSWDNISPRTPKLSVTKPTTEGKRPNWTALLQANAGAVILAIDILIGKQSDINNILPPSSIKFLEIVNNSSRVVFSKVN